MGSEQSGVYAITHPSSGKTYIGSSLDVVSRCAGHQRNLRVGTHSNKYLQNAWSRHGEASFHFHILEYCHQDERIAREQFWIDQVQASNRAFGFNLSSMAHAGCPGEEGRLNIAESNRRRTGTSWIPKNRDEWRAKISASRSGKKYGPRSPEVGEKISEALKGQKLTEARKAKIGAAHKGKIRGPHSDTHRKNLSLAHLSRTPEQRAEALAKNIATRNAKKEVR